MAAPSLAALLGTEVVRAQSGVEYRELRSRSLVGRCSRPGMPFDWTVNPYRGCAMGCRYCYAAYTHDFIGRDGATEFHSQVYVKVGGEEATARRLIQAARRGEPVALGTATDPYQPAESHWRVTRRFLETASAVRGLRLSITTKGALVLRDVELLRRIASRGELSVAVSLVSSDAALLRRIEPWAPPPELRLEVLRRLLAEGLDAGLALAPILPTLTDSEESLDSLFARAAAVGVRRVFSQLLFLRSPTREKYLAWLKTAFPERVADYERLFAGRTRLGGNYKKRLGVRIARLRLRHGLVEDLHDARLTAPRPLQLRLFD